MSSRWANPAKDAARAAAQKKEKAQKRRHLKHQNLQAPPSTAMQSVSATIKTEHQEPNTGTEPGNDEPAFKRRRITVLATAPANSTSEADAAESPILNLLQFEGGTFGPPVVDWGIYEKMNDIGHGSYGRVFRARRQANGRVYAIKQLKPEKIGHGLELGLPVTGMREIQILRSCEHRNVVKMLEVVSGSRGASIDRVSIVLEFIEHDLRTILHTMPSPFQASEVKTLMLQLVQGIQYLHDRWILHRDLKPNNLLLTNRGVLKIADFGMARFIGDPPPRDLTTSVVTLWYRAPELLLGAKTYSAAIDMWSVGCIFAEIISQKTLFNKKVEAAMVQSIVAFCGPWTAHKWPEMRRLRNYTVLNMAAIEKRDINPVSAIETVASINKKFPDMVSGGAELMAGLLMPCPDSRLTAAQALASKYFSAQPPPKQESLFPTFPSKGGQEARVYSEQEPVAPVRDKSV